MKKIIHLSDLHFGTEREGIVEKLIHDVNQLAPDMILISGDLTQRARHFQFKLAKHFIQALDQKNILCVPGNHDISLYNLVERFLYPFAKYKKWITPMLCAHSIGENVVILGLNSVTPYKPMSGYITDKQLKLVIDFFKNQPEEKIKIIVMHHNLISSERHKILNDAEKIINIFSECKINLVLSGHIHHPCIELIKRNYLTHHLYIITAGTAISTRTIQPNSFNVIELENDQFKLSVRGFIEDKFSTISEEIFPL